MGERLGNSPTPFNSCEALRRKASGGAATIIDARYCGPTRKLFVLSSIFASRNGTTQVRKMRIRGGLS